MLSLSLFYILLSWLMVMIILLFLAVVFLVIIGVIKEYIREIRLKKFRKNHFWLSRLKHLS